MNYLGYVYTQIFNHLFDRFEGIDRSNINLIQLVFFCMIETYLVLSS